MVLVYVGSSPIVHPNREVEEWFISPASGVGAYAGSSPVFPTNADIAQRFSAPACHAGDGSSILLICSKCNGSGSVSNIPSTLNIGFLLGREE